MPVPQPNPGEKYKKFLKRFLSNNDMKKEFPEIKQRFAVAASTWRNK